MESPGLLAKLLEQVQLEFTKCKPLIPTYSHLLVSALFPIYIGAHASLTRPSSAAKPTTRKNKLETDDENEDSDEEDDESSLTKMEGLEPSDAIMFPVMAGLTLGGLYLLINWLNDPAILNKILGFYFSQAGTVFAIAFMGDGLSVLRSFIFPSRYVADGVAWKANQCKRAFVPVEHDGLPLEEVREERKSPLPGSLGESPLPASFLEALWSVRGIVYRKATLRAYIRGVVEVKSRFTILDIVGSILGLVAVYYFTFVKKPWWLTNFLGFSFSYGAMQFMSPTTFWTGSLVLSALFFYDIYFVFFTPLMVTVAKSLDIPIKLVFPRPPSPGQDRDSVNMAMLGLGDIVIPGMVIGLALRFDLFLYYKLKGAMLSLRADGRGVSNSEPGKIIYVNATGRWGERFWSSGSTSSPVTNPSQCMDGGKLTFNEAKSFPKTYFYASLIGYVMGMLATLLAMQISGHAQPALLYLVPGVLGSLWTTAFVKGDIKEMWNFSDAIQEEEEEITADKDKEKKMEEKENAPSAMGLFRKVFFGKDSKASTNPFKSPKGKFKEPSAHETSTSRDIFSFSISIPKSKAITNPSTNPITPSDKDKVKKYDTKLSQYNPAARRGEGDDEEEVHSSYSDSTPSSSLSSPLLVGGIDIQEPAMKRRRAEGAGDRNRIPS
ncbi:peptidase A22B family protein [Paracoccidioides lutzii Pb01]|uniref:Peptidase A22B family protein n=1 Tax=Paracoccidioides lutzii (strain ATCC MYA-826 / Pb01) TaxID=502779 RepID=C1H657_PARBA|nr:peptidase A22B family protein [Paracoccidioides lutzii Pb01]EEH35120.1 peptidase A22B family protein [Paracoccidioides lutzii Pb01]